MTFFSCLDLSVGLVEQQVGMTDIHLPQCVCVFPLILELINSISDLCQSVYTAAVDALIGPSLLCQSGHRNNALCSLSRLRLSVDGDLVSGGDEHFWPCVG